jgi:5-methylcytosine-specific restriction endonuclease McrA
MTDKIYRVISQIEQVPLAVVTRSGPWLTPLVPAYFIKQALVDNVHMPEGWAWTAAMSIEIVGIAATNNMLRAYQWNREKRKTDPAAPIGWNIAAVTIYFVTAFTIVLLVGLFPELSRIIPAAFVVLSGASAMVLALSYDQLRREQEVAESKSARKLDSAPVWIEQSEQELATKFAKSEHRANMEFPCSLCNVSFPTRNALNAHKRKHSQRPAGVSKEAWRKAVFAVRNANIRASKMGVNGVLTPEEWLQVLDRYSPDGKCPSCKNVLPLCLDHINLLAHGGPNTVDNIQPLCKSCNSSKSGADDYRFDKDDFTYGKVTVSANGHTHPH